MQFFDRENAIIVCLYLAITEMIIGYFTIMDEADYLDGADVPIYDYLYGLDILLVSLLWMIAVFFFVFRTTSKANTFGAFLMIVGTILLFDRILCIFADVLWTLDTEGEELDAVFFIVYLLGMVINGMLVVIGYKTYKGLKFYSHTRGLIIFFLVGSILFRAYQLYENRTALIDFIEMESSILLFIFILASLFDEDIKKCMGVEIREDLDEFYI